MPQEPETTWRLIRDELRGTVSEVAFDTWLEPVEMVALRGDELVVSAPEGATGWIEKRYLGAISARPRRSSAHL